MTEKCSGNIKTCKVSFCLRCMGCEDTERKYKCEFSEEEFERLREDARKMALFNEAGVTTPAALAELKQDAEKWRKRGSVIMGERRSLDELERKAAWYDAVIDQAATPQDLERDQKDANKYREVVERAKKQLSVTSNACERCIIEEDIEGQVFSNDVARIIRRVMGWEARSFDAPPLNQTTFSATFRSPISHGSFKRGITTLWQRVVNKD